LAAALESIHAVTGAVVDRSRGGSVGRQSAHLGAWLSEAATQLTSIAARSYEARDLDVDAQNAKTLLEVPWDEAWRHATGARAIMLQHWFALRVGAMPRTCGYGKPRRGAPRAPMAKC
jgi:hypothetical protein